MDNLLKSTLNVVVLSGFESVVVKYNQRLSSIIAAGNYHNADELIRSDLFPHNRKRRQVELTVELICYKEFTYCESALHDMHSNGFRPATLMELLAFQQKNPDVPNAIALGSSITISSSRYSPCFYTVSVYPEIRHNNIIYPEIRRRTLQLLNENIGLHTGTCFAAIRL